LVHPIFADIWDDLDGARGEAAMVEQAHLRGVSVLASEHDPLERWLYVSALASGIEKIYGGIEKALVRIARSIDGDVPEGADWHITLLRRMSRPGPSGRPIVLAPDTRRQLDQLRAFRHRERNSYAEELRADLVMGIAADISATLDSVAADIRRLQEALKA
jgi:hypothetical protein